METSQSQVTEALFVARLKAALRCVGLMSPVTPEQVELFEQSKASQPVIPDLLADPIAMLDRGYIGPPEAKTSINQHEDTDTNACAARKGLNISEQTWQKMHEDRAQAERNKLNK